VDKRWYLDVNSFARSTHWAHTFMVWYFERLAAPIGAGVVFLALLVLAGWWSARRHPAKMPAVAWAAFGAGVAFGLDELLVRVLSRPFPFEQLSRVEVLVPRAPGHLALPAVHTAVAAAAVAGLALGGRWKLAALGALASLLLAFAGVYVGYYYPSDAASGLGFGLVCSLVLWPLGSWLISPVVSRLSRSSLAWFVASRSSVARGLGAAQVPPARRARGLVVIPKPAGPRLPNAKAMDALRVATQAARNTPMAPGPASKPPEGVTGPGEA
jgi:hypothetical protein